LAYCVLEFENDTRVAEPLADLLGKNFTAPELLTAFVALYKEHTHAKFRVHLCHLVGLTPWNDPIASMLTHLATVDQDDAFTIINELIEPALSDVQAVALMERDELGLLTRSLHNTVLSQWVYPRAGYLRGRLPTHNLSAAQSSLAETLSMEWVGTLDALVDTVRSLAPR